jgi:cytochrome c-type biogenesis protein CcmH/NrfF
LIGRGLLLLAAAAVLALATVFVVAPGAFAADKAVANQITDEIICPCDCGEVLTGCICELGIEMKGSVENSLKAGKTKEQITAALVSKYGEVVLGAPKAKGFNIIVWVAPFLATLMGMVIAFFVLRRWTSRKPALEAAGGSAGPVAGAPPTDSDSDLDALRARAEEEIRRLRG